MRRQLLIAMLLALHAAGNLAAVLIAGNFYWESRPEFGVHIVFHGLITSQPVLVAMGAAFFRGFAPVRAVLAYLSLVFLVVGPVVILPAAWRQGVPSDILPTYLGYQTALFGVSAAVFMLIRGPLHWRIALRQTQNDAPGPRRAKLALSDLFVVTTFGALALVGLRAYGANLNVVSWQLAKDVLQAVIALAFLPLCLADKRPVRTWGAVALVLAADFGISAILLPWGFVQASFPLQWFEFSLGFFGSVAVSLCAARAAGDRLARQHDCEQQDAPPKQP
jgi:hypothetical protein